MPVPRHRADVGSPRSGGEIRPGQTGELEGSGHQGRLAESSRPRFHEHGGYESRELGDRVGKHRRPSNEAAGPATRSRWAMRSRCRGLPPGMEAPRHGVIPWSSPTRARECSRSLQPQPPRVDAAQPTPRWPDGQPRLGPPPGQIVGYWAFPSATTLVEQGANVQADAHGMLRNIADIDKVAPFQRWARDLYELRQRNFLKDDPMFIFCKPQAGPRIFQLPYGVQFLEERDHQRIRVMMGAGNQNWHFIYTDGRPRPRSRRRMRTILCTGAARSANGKATRSSSIPTGFNDSFWFSNGGLAAYPAASFDRALFAPGSEHVEV